MNQIDVTAAIITRSNQVFAARRKPGMHLAGFWEFPGGKIEAGEAAEDCLKRELHEEFGIIAEIGPYFGESIYEYEKKTVRLLAYRVEEFTGDFQLTDHDEIRWLGPDDLQTVKWAPADVTLVELYETLIRTA